MVDKANHVIGLDNVQVVHNTQLEEHKLGLDVMHSSFDKVFLSLRKK